MGIQKHIPNFITLLNLFCGCIALIFLSSTLLPDGFISDPEQIEMTYMLNFELAFWFVCLGIIFDFFDGFFARMFNVSGPLGLQLDSLADMVTSGVVPGFAMFSMMTKAEGIETLPSFFPYLGFLITLGACLRLARFNIDTRQTSSFIGLPTPGNCLFILSLPLIALHSDSLLVFEILINPWVLLFISIMSFWIMNAEIPLFSLKVKKFTVKDNIPQIVFLPLAILLIVMFQFSGIPLVIISYILISIVNNIFQKN